MKKICKLCGKEFEAKGRQSICKRVHYNKCVQCGKEFEVNPSTYTRKTCSSECNKERNRTSALQRHACKDYSWTNKTSKGKYLRTCEICKAVFYTNSKSRNICYKDHILDCVVCGKPYHVIALNHGYKQTCSYSCAAELRARNEQAKNGVRSTLQRPEVKEKIKQSNLKRYGVENVLSSSSIRQQIKETCLEKYGVECITQSDEMKSKSKETCLERYGTEYAIESNKIQQQIRQTNVEKYGVDNIFKSSKFKEDLKQQMLETYGVEYYIESKDFKIKQQKAWQEKYGGNPWSTEEVRQKCSETNLERYGDIWPQRVDEVKQKQINTFIQHRADLIHDEDARNNYLEFKQNPQEYIRKHSNSGISIAKMSKQLGYTDGTFLYDYVHKNGMEDVLRWSGISKMEQDIIDFIQSLDSKIEIQIHNRTVIYPKEIDILLPQYKIGIECNPTITHNSTFVMGNVLGDLQYPVTPIDYHLMKTNMCENNGYFLFHIFGYEWTNHKDVICSMIQNLLGKNPYRLYARNLSIAEVSNKDANYFLDQNHRQGSAPSSTRLGLYTKDGKLVSLMTFGHIRNTIGFEKSENNAIELVRFCNKLNTTIIGGASKLFKHYIKHYNPAKIISFSDKAHTRGNLYSILGFTKVRESDPGYVWVNLNTDLYLHRMSCQKRNLPKLFNEPNLDIENQTEQQIMASKGFVQVFDSGTIRWEYTMNR